MLVALAVLLAALIVVIIKDRQFWFPPTPEPVATDQTPAPAAATPAPASAAPPVVTSPPPKPTSHAKSKKNNKTSSPGKEAEQAAPEAAMASPVVTTTSRAVLPPLEIEVVAGNQHRTLASGNSSVKVDMQPGGTGAPDASASQADPGSMPANASLNTQVSMSPRTAERVSRSVQPNYPLLAKQMKVQGAVVLQALIDRSGNIEDLHVVSGPAILSAAAQEAVKQWHFRPYLQAGRPVETEARITVNFTISTY